MRILSEKKGNKSYDKMKELEFIRISTKYKIDITLQIDKVFYKDIIH
jgi:hypothetical protein